MSIVVQNPTPEILKKIISLINNVFTSNFNQGAIKGLVKYIEKCNPILTNTSDGIAIILQYECRYLELIIRLIVEYVPKFIESFQSDITEVYSESRQKCIILISAYLANYNNFYTSSQVNVGIDIDEYLYHNLNQMRLRYDIVDIPLKEQASGLREWYRKRYNDAGFILWEDPILGDIDNLIA
jgi:hypothetical protein